MFGEMPRRVILLACLVAACSSLDAEPACVAFHPVLRCAQAPVVDGDPSDACWQGLPVMDLFYQYWSPIPKPPPLTTEARLCFDGTGLYMGITMYEDALDKVKATVRDRDNPQTWMDDCVEIMLDPHNTGSSYYKLTTNLNGARHDQRSVNLTLDDAWSPEGWGVGIGKGTDAWFIELALPWQDIGVAPREGDVWSFDLVRYGYSTGSFRGVTWSLGGAGAQPAKFGYLGFGQFDTTRTADLERIARAAQSVKGAEWYMLAPSGVTLRRADATWTRRSLRTWACDPLRQAETALATATVSLLAMPAGAKRTELEAQAAKLTERLAALDGRAPRGAKLTPLDAALVRQEGALLLRDALEAQWGAMLWGLLR